MLIGGPQATASCDDDLTFTLSGYRCDIPVKIETGSGELVSGPAGVAIKLRHNIHDGYERVALTDSNGIAAFENVPDSILIASIEQEGSREDKPLYKVKETSFQVVFNTETGFWFENNPDGFVIETTLVEGWIKQQLNDAAPASFIRVVALTLEGAVVQTVLTNSNGRYQLDTLRAGKYVVRPESANDETTQIFKPANRTVTVELGKKNTVAGFQVFGGSISGQVKSLRGAPIGGATISVDGVSKAVTDSNGVYYLKFESFPSEHTIEATGDYYIFNPIKVTVTEETRQLPPIQASVTYVCGSVWTIDEETN